MNLTRLKILTVPKEGKEEERHKAYRCLGIFTHMNHTHSTHPCIFPTSKPDDIFV